MIWSLKKFNVLLYIRLLRYGPGGRRNVDEFSLSAEACLPIISGILAEIRKNTYPRNSFLNINIPADVVNHKVILDLLCNFLTISFP